MTPHSSQTLDEVMKKLAAQTQAQPPSATVTIPRQTQANRLPQHVRPTSDSDPIVSFAVRKSVAERRAVEEYLSLALSLPGSPLGNAGAFGPDSRPEDVADYRKALTKDDREVASSYLTEFLAHAMDAESPFRALTVLENALGDANGIQNFLKDLERERDLLKGGDENEYFVGVVGRTNSFSGHMFVLFGRHDVAAGMSISDGVWGFYPKSEDDYGIETVPGAILNEIVDKDGIPPGSTGCLVIVSSDEYAKAKAVRDQWVAKTPDFRLWGGNRNNCIDFVAAVAATIKLKIPVRSSTQKPNRFVAELQRLNKDDPRVKMSFAPNPAPLPKPEPVIPRPNNSLGTIPNAVPKEILQRNTPR